MQFTLCVLPFFLSFPCRYELTLSSLNAITLINSDIGNYAALSAFLTQGSFLHPVVGADPWILRLIPEVFSAHISLAVPSSIIHAETYQLFNLVLYLFFVFSLPFIFIIAKDIFKLRDSLAFIVTGLAGINYNLILIVYFGYLSQIIGMGYFLSVTFLVLFFIQRREKITTLITYVPLFALLLSGLLVSYPIYLPLFFIPLAFYLACDYIWLKRLGNVRDLVIVFLISGLVSGILFPALLLSILNELPTYSSTAVGFNANPLLPSWMLGLFTGIVPFDQLVWGTMPPVSAADIFLAVIVVIVACLSLRYLYTRDKDLFTISIFFGIFVFSFYLFLISKEFSSPGSTGEGYKGYKLVTYFIPLFIVVGLAYFNKFNFREHYDAKKIAAFIILILFIGLSVFSVVQIVSVNYQRSVSINPDIIELEAIGGMPNITSVNVDDPAALTHFWMYYFIFLNKKTYSSFHYVPLQGEWTIRRGTEADVKKILNNSTNESIVRVNAVYYLVKGYCFDYQDQNMNIFSLPPCKHNSSQIGAFRNGRGWYLDSTGDGEWGPGDSTFGFGRIGDVPVTGDWNGDEKTEIGVFRNGRDWYLDSTGDGEWGPGDSTFGFGRIGDVPVTGDWNGDEKTEIGVFRNGRDWYLDSTGDGEWGPGDSTFGFGRIGDVPVTGDWNGDEKTEIGVFRNGRDWYLDSTGDGEWGPGDSTFGFGRIGDVPVTGDWNGDEKTEIGVFRNGRDWTLDSTGDGVLGSGDNRYRFDINGDLPVTGRWS